MEAFVAFVIALSVLVVAVECIPVEDLYPYGLSTGDHSLSATNTSSSSAVELGVEFRFYERNHRTIHVNSNGIVSFMKPTMMLPHQTFPVGEDIVLIAPFWSEVGIGATGEVFFRQTKNSLLLERAATEIQGAFSNYSDFVPTLLMVTTWDHVGCSCTQTTNTYQCILATNRTHSFVVFYYADGLMTWRGVCDDASGQGAHVGFNAGVQGRFLTLPNSHTNNVLNVTTTSNVGRPGVWMFKVDSSTIESPGLSLWLDQAEHTVNEAAGVVSICAFLSGTIEQTITVRLTTSERTAKGVADFNGGVMQLAFQPDKGAGPLCTTISILDDSRVEDNEVFSVHITSDGPEVDIALGSATVIILDNDVVPVRFQQMPFTIIIPEDSENRKYVCVLWSGEIDVNLSVTISTLDFTAEGGQDFIKIMPSEILLSTSPQSRCFRVEVIDDSIVEEGEESFFLHLSTSSEKVYLRQDRLQVTITDNDVVYVGFADYGNYSVNEDGDFVHVCAKMEGVSQRREMLLLSSDDGTAKSGRDYVEVSSDIIFEPLEQLSCTEVSILDNRYLTSQRTKFFTLSLSSVDARVLLNDVDSATVIIQEDDVATVSLQQEGYQVDERGGTVDICVSLNVMADFTVHAIARTSALSATGNVDYMETVAGIVFQPDSTNLQCLIITVLDDTTMEGIESFKVSLSTTDNAVSIASDTTTVFILDDDRVTIGLEYEEYIVAEHNETITVCAKVDGKFDRDLQIMLTTTPDTAQADVDYVSISTPLVFQTGHPNNQIKCGNVRIEDDDVFEGIERFLINLSSGSELVMFNGSSAFVVILDNDYVTIGLNETDYTVGEGCGYVSVCIDLLGLIGRGVRVQAGLNTADGSAQAGTDYNEGTTMLYFGDLETSQQSNCINIFIQSDTVLEDSESFTIHLESTNHHTDSRVSLGTVATARITILDDDNVTVGMESESYTADESDRQTSVCIVLWGETERDVEVNFYTLAQSAKGEDDFHHVFEAVTFKPSSNGEVTTYQCINISLVDDYAVEEVEVFTVALNKTDENVILNPEMASITVTDSDVVCGTQKTFAARGNYDWNETIPNTWEEQKCAYGEEKSSGMARRFCNSAGSWHEPALQECFGDTTDLFEEILKHGFSGESLEAHVLAVKQATERGDENEVYLEIIDGTFDELAALVKDDNGTVNEKILGETLEILSVIQSWNETVLQEHSSRIIESVEAVAVGLLNNENFTEKTFINEGLALRAAKEDTTELQLSGIEVSYTMNAEDALHITADAYNSTNVSMDRVTKISLPPSVFNKVNNEKTGLIFSLYESAVFFPLAKHYSKQSNNYAIRSPVAAATLAGETIVNLKDPVIIVLKLYNERYSFPTCVSWNFSAAGGKGNWTTMGCETEHARNGEVTCYCNHLTNFAVLVDVRSRMEGPSVDKENQRALETISIAGAVLSVVGLTLTIITLLAFRKLRSRDSSKFRIQLCIAMVCMLVVFMAGIDRTEVYGVCVAMSALLHYFTLVAVMWMGAEALLMFQKLVIVFAQITTKYIIIVSLVCWSLPIPAVIIPLALDRNYVVSPNFCFISNIYVFFNAFLGPIFIVILFNMVIFAMVMYVIIKHSYRKVENSNKDAKRKGVFRTLMSVMGVMTLFGLSWLFGAFTFKEASIVFQYLFAIFSSLQGFFIFLFFCVFAEDTRNLWLQAFGCRKKKPTTTTSLLSRRLSTTRLSLVQRDLAIIKSQSEGGGRSLEMAQMEENTLAAAEAMQAVITPTANHWNIVFLEKAQIEENTLAKDPAAEAMQAVITPKVHWNIVFVQQTINALMFQPEIKPDAQPQHSIDEGPAASSNAATCEPADSPDKKNPGRQPNEDIKHFNQHSNTKWQTRGQHYSTSSSHNSSKEPTDLDAAC